MKIRVTISNLFWFLIITCLNFSITGMEHWSKKKNKTKKNKEEKKNKWKEFTGLSTPIQQIMNTVFISAKIIFLLANFSITKLRVDY